MVGGPKATGLVKNDAVSVVTEDNVVCGTCGSGSLSQLIAKCARCNDYEHGYCMKVLIFDIPREWYCAKCQEYASGGPKPSQGGQTELQKPRHGRDMMNERETSKLHLSHSNVVPQISPKSADRFGNAKVKFVSSEETALLSRERPPLVRSRFAVPQPSKAPSPSTTKHLSNLNCVFPSRSDTQVQALKRCADASHSQTKIEDRSYFAMQQRQVHPASPPGMKQPSNMKSISPSRSDTQVQNLKSVTPSKVSSRVCDTIKMIPSDLQLELLPRMNDWPKSFETIPPVHEDIGVFFFFDRPVGCEKKHSNLLEDSNNYVLRAYIDGIKLLIYSSEVLPPDSQWIDGENYLWGLFVRSKGKSDPWQIGSTTT